MQQKEDAVGVVCGILSFILYLIYKVRTLVSRLIANKNDKDFNYSLKKFDEDKNCESYLKPHQFVYDYTNFTILLTK